MKENYIKKLIDGYLYQKKINSDVVYIEKLGNSIIIHVTKLFSSQNFVQGFDLIQYINNIINQANEKTYHMQNVYLDTDEGLIIDEIMLELEVDDFNRINQKIAEILKI
ncbi:hypothetical protein [Leuconostoc mesenteroides]|uniref:hypothetical protein n=1 Tax=Leuconostoc mesenteroides TaxID=1245 RepID=UPI0021BF1231|nr:hypothetical protein [Leuconostoc mesenteroides]MCT8385670.1 hypothetical protein [Leuconostoc mesenteroides]